MLTYQQALASLQPQDIFHAGRPSGASAPCLVLSVSDTRITARRMTTQEIFEFDRITGQAIDGAFQIDCVAPFPVKMQSILKNLDEKYQRKLTDDEIQLHPTEIKAILGIQPHVTQNFIKPIL